ncbi:MAG TPA: hypothetical protein VFO28_09435 [Burkholderiaceae bacterium]|nr:hypothetical protein [Burkholderiaceae bacterium]
MARLKNLDDAMVAEERVSPRDEVQNALAASNEADLKVRACVKAVVTGQMPRDPAHFRQLVAERNAAFATFLQAFIRRSREKSALPDENSKDAA